MFTIGELSKISQISVKCIRYYQELGLISPVKIDPLTNYRYFNKESYERINRILILKDLGFTLLEIKTILDKCEDERELKDFISSKLAEIKIEVKKLKDMELKLKRFDSDIDDKIPLVDDKIVEIEFDLPVYASVKIDGTYEDIGHGYRTIYKNVGRYVKGKPYSLFYDLEYKDENPNFEAALELSRKSRSTDVKLGAISRSKAVKLSYRGPYGGQGEAYLRLFHHCHECGYSVKLPIIEHYLKGPGYILKGNPQNYITECILLIE